MHNSQQQQLYIVDNFSFQLDLLIYLVALFKRLIVEIRNSVGKRKKFITKNRLSTIKSYPLSLQGVAGETRRWSSRSLHNRQGGGSRERQTRATEALLAFFSLVFAHLKTAKKKRLLCRLAIAQTKNICIRNRFSLTLKID